VKGGMNCMPKKVTGGGFSAEGGGMLPVMKVTKVTCGVSEVAKRKVNRGICGFAVCGLVPLAVSGVSPKFGASLLEGSW